MFGLGVAVAGAIYAIAGCHAWRGQIPLKNLGIVRRGDPRFRLALMVIVTIASVILVVSLLVPGLSKSFDEVHGTPSTARSRR
jgi:hypothetical protein